MIDSILERDALTVEFQPIFDLALCRIYGYEALGRFRGELPGLPDAVPPGPEALLDLARREGFLLALDGRWRELAIKAIIHTAVNPRFRFFLNLDTRGLEDEAFDPDFTARLVQRYGLAPQRFVIELTERDVALQSQNLVRLTRKLRSQGFKIALDDVGSGYASLTAIVNLRPDIIKLDRALLKGISLDPFRQGLIQALIDFCRRCHIQCIAEGIETVEDLSWIVRSGIILGQGYLLGYPGALPPQSTLGRVPAPNPLALSPNPDPLRLSAPAQRPLLSGGRLPEIIYEA